MSTFKHTVTAQDVSEQLAVKSLLRRYFKFSARLRTKIKKNNLVFLNNKPVGGWIVPKLGDVILVKLPEEKSYFEPENIPIHVIYEDKDLLIINKQAGVVVHPTSGCPNNTIANGIAKYILDTNQSFKIRFINRLDMDTSGLLLLGKHSHVQDAFVKSQAQGLVEKKYVALCHGLLNGKGTIDAPIGKPSAGAICRCVQKDGRESITHYQVLDTYPVNNVGGFTLLELLLETGRTHQIRVHLSHIGHPIVGDTLYGSKVSPDFFINRQALHAEELSFPHPMTNVPMSFHAPLPADITSLLDDIKKTL